MDAATSALKPNEKVKMKVRNLNFYYGKFQALKNINLEIPEKKVTAFIGPSGLRQVDAAARLQPDVRALSGAARRGRSQRRRRQRPDVEGGCRADPRQDRHDLPEADTVSDVDLRQHRLRREAVRESVEVGAWTTGSSGRCARARCGTRSRTSSGRAVPACRAASSSGCASRAASRCGPRSSCSTSRARRSTRSPPRRSRN